MAKAKSGSKGGTKAKKASRAKKPAKAAKKPATRGKRKITKARSSGGGALGLAANLSN